MTDIEKAIRWFENIANECDKLTSGNVAHLKAQIKGMAIRSAEYLTKHSQEPASEDLEQAAEECVDSEDYPYIDRDGLPLYTPDYLTYMFRQGAQWDREQMMKGAIDAQVSYLANERTGMKHLKAELPMGTELDFGDKVKIIIIKE